MNEQKMFEVAERVRSLERAFDAREGLTRKDDTLPERFFKDPVQDGKYEGAVLDKSAFEKMKDEYYRLRGWDVKTGIPTMERLKELGLNDVAEELAKLRKIQSQ